jgi:plastocyanin
VIRAATLVAVAFAVAALLGAGEGAAVEGQNSKLFGSVGPGFEISFRDAQGNRVTRLEPGTYDVQVEDRSEEHSFHLRGPGVEERTGVTSTETVTWTVTFRDGNYRYHCDPHPTLGGDFVVGNPQQTPPPAATPTVTAKSRLVVTAGPADVITLRTAAGANVKQMTVGTYNVTVRDRGRDHNVHLVGPGYNRRTQPLSYRGTQTWKVRLARAGTLRFLCDPHAALGMRGSARIVR